MIFEEEILESRNTAASKTRRCGSVHLGDDALGVCEVFYVYQGYVSSAVALYILGVVACVASRFSTELLGKSRLRKNACYAG